MDDPRLRCLLRGGQRQTARAPLLPRGLAPVRPSGEASGAPVDCRVPRGTAFGGKTPVARLASCDLHFVRVRAESRAPASASHPHLAIDPQLSARLQPAREAAAWPPTRGSGSVGGMGVVAREEAAMPRRPAAQHAAAAFPLRVSAAVAPPAVEGDPVTGARGNPAMLAGGRLPQAAARFHDHRLLSLLDPSPLLQRRSRIRLLAPQSHRVAG